ncbi:MAG: DNA-3-methyladenine glycosylase [Oligoflexia bacterium]|nr:DNA-3-methyladenine glycosylase [Oligoflexia bacterium]
MPVKLKRSFFEKPTLAVARKLLGMQLVTMVGGKITSGTIVEVEAYHQRGDRASHSYRGPTPRSAIMFGVAGHCYVYFIYGAHFCVNIVTEKAGTGAAILIRALEPLRGVATMKRRRHTSQLKSLTNGPGKLCQALGINRNMLGEDLLHSKRIWIESGLAESRKQIGTSIRIGISKSKRLPWRFFLKNSPYLSR